MGSSILLDLTGGVALLLWGLHMVHSGIVRAFGSNLRRFLGRALRSRVLAFGAGIFVTALLQSSTATGLMTASFVSGGTVDLVPALAIMLGANVGTTLIVQLLSFNVTAVSPLLFVIGVVAFKRGKQPRTRDLGRVAIGVGLMLLSLHILLDTLAPAETAPAVRTLLAATTRDPILCLLGAAALTWAAHSSVTVVLLVMSLAYSGFVTPAAAIALILGANLGSAINPLIEGSHSDNPASRRLPIGNLVNRVVGCALVVPFVNPIAEVFTRFEPNPSRMAADFHTVFNLVLALIFFLPLAGLAALLRRFLPDRPQPTDLSTPLYLDESALASPSVALACAARETLHIGDIVETMLRKTMEALRTDNRELIAEICTMDDAVDKLDEAVKLYVTKVTRESLGERDGQRAMEIISFSINLEHVGRHHRQESDGARQQEDQAQPLVLQGRGGGAGRLPPGGAGQSQAGDQHLHDRGCDRGPTIDHREGEPAGRGIRRGGEPPGALARRARGEHRIELAAPRYPARPEAHPLAYLLRRLPRAGAHGRASTQSPEGHLSLREPVTSLNGGG